MKTTNIKFKGKDVNGKWRFGGIYGLIAPHIIHDWQFTEVDPKTVSQFTGAIDCESKDIYEYDFVIFIGGGETPKIVIHDGWHPEFRLQSCNKEGFLIGLSYTLDYEQSREAFKVVGNIFDNPELIPKEVYGRLMEMIKNDDY